MSQSKFASRLAKELTRNPKKSTVLALLLAVAVWFWVPLAWKWLSPAGEDVVEVEENIASLKDTETVDQPAATSSPTTSGAVDQSWRGLSTLFAGHQLMATAKLREDLASPFGIVEDAQAVSEETIDNEGEAVAAPVGATLTPEQLGLALSSTITGRGASMALINGKACPLGAVLVISGHGKSNELRLVEIQADWVQLFDGREMHKLERKAPESTMQLSRAGGREHPSQQDVDDRILIDPGHRD